TSALRGFDPGSGRGPCSRHNSGSNPKKAGQSLQQARRLIHLGRRPATWSRVILAAGEELADALSALLLACVARFGGIDRCHKPQMRNLRRTDTPEGANLRRLTSPSARSQQVPPHLPGADEADGRRADAELPRQAGLALASRGPSADGQHVL